MCQKVEQSFISLRFGYMAFLQKLFGKKDDNTTTPVIDLTTDTKTPTTTSEEPAQAEKKEEEKKKKKIDLEFPPCNAELEKTIAKLYEEVQKYCNSLNNIER